MSKLPTETRPIRLIPELAAVVEDELAPLTGKRLEAGQAALLAARAEGPGTFTELAARYQGAIRTAAAGVA